jgi:ElaB/YqjD/DUF883 family membrane-anchored ribosome-binding protein
MHARNATARCDVPAHQGTPVDTLCCSAAVAKPPDFNALMENMMAQLDTTTRGRKNGHARTALKARANDVLDDFVELRKDMSRLAEAANKAARSEVKDAGHRLEVIGKDLRTRANDSAGYAVEKVREHPGAALGISLGAGLLLGMLISRR